MKCLVTAIGSLSAEAVIGRLAQQPGVKIIGCNMYPASWTPASRLVNRFYNVPSAKSDNYINSLLEICQCENVTHIIALTDPEIDIISDHDEWFISRGIVLCMPSQSAVRMARDKLLIYEKFVNHPRISPILTADFQEVASTTFPLPWIAKPRRGRSSEGHIQITDVDALQFWRKRLANLDYLVQPYYEGSVMVVDVVRQPDDGTSVAVTRQELLRTTNGAGLTVRMQPNHACDVLAREIADSLNIRGCINVEFLVVDNIPLLMDVNPRFSAGVSFTIKAGYDMVKNHLNCFSNGKLDPCVVPRPDVYARGFVEYSLGN